MIGCSAFALTCQYVKAAVANTPGLKPVADQLGARFAKTTKAATPATPAAHA